MDDTPVPETLETIAENIASLRKSMDLRFEETNAQVGVKIEALRKSMDLRFEDTNAQVGVKIEALRKSMDLRFEDTNAQLGVKIEAVDARVTLVFDAVISLRELADINTKDHQRFTERLDKHDVRILALEPSKPAKP